MLFKDRFDAGMLLAAKLTSYRKNKDAIVVAIPRGGVQVGSALAKHLHVPLTFLLVKKLEHPMNPEYAIGAVGLTEVILNDALILQEEISRGYIDSKVEGLRIRIKKRYELYGGEDAIPSFKDKTIILTDDGIATGFTLLAAVDVIRRQFPKKIILAIPVAASDSLEAFREKVDDIICLHVPDVLQTVGQCYLDFKQVEDSEVISLLKHQ